MSGSQAPGWRFLITPKWLGWHLFTVVAVIGMLWLGDWQLHRALAGNGLRSAEPQPNWESLASRLCRLP